MSNQKIAQLFYEIANILEIQGVEWKPQAYRRAARAIESLSEDVKKIYEKNNLKGLKEIPGVGDALAKKIIEYIKTKKIKEYIRLRKTLPKHLLDLMEIPGIGPKKIKKLYKELGIKTIDQLKKAALQHKIAKLPLFKEKTEENILQSLGLVKKEEKRIPLAIAEVTANSVVKELKKLKEINQIVVAGSIRRKKATVRDIDILITSKNPKKVVDFFMKIPLIKRVLSKGPTRSTVILKNNIQVDIRIVPEKCFGSALQYFTGSKEHSIKLRKIAIKKGLKLSEYGLFDRKTNKMVAGKTENEIYNKLGLNYIKPEERENKGEIEKALKK